MTSCTASAAAAAIGMAHIGVAVLKGAGAAREGLVNPLRQHDRADRLIAAA